MKKLTAAMIELKIKNEVLHPFLFTCHRLVQLATSKKEGREYNFTMPNEVRVLRGTL
jgi:hypothetical protein